MMMFNKLYRDETALRVDEKIGCGRYSWESFRCKIMLIVFMFCVSQLIQPWIIVVQIVSVGFYVT